jgi:hypothetical protein
MSSFIKSTNQKNVSAVNNNFNTTAATSITFQIKLNISANGQIIYSSTSSNTPPKYRHFSSKEITATMQNDIHQPPPPLFEKNGVPHSTYRRIYKLIQKELLPIAGTSFHHNCIHSYEMSHYIDKQMCKGSIGFGYESTHEKKVFEMTRQSFALQRAVDLKAGWVKDLVNGMLGRYGLLATLALRRVGLEKYSTKQKEENETLEVVGLEFYDLNGDDDGGGSDVAATASVADAGVERQTVDSA